MNQWVVVTGKGADLDVVARTSARWCPRRQPGPHPDLARRGGAQHRGLPRSARCPGAARVRRRRGRLRRRGAPGDRCVRCRRVGRTPGARRHWHLHRRARRPRRAGGGGLGHGHRRRPRARDRAPGRRGAGRAGRQPRPRPGGSRGLGRCRGRGAARLRARLRGQGQPVASLVHDLFLVTPNADEIAALTGRAAVDWRGSVGDLHERGVEHVWLRHGAEGSWMCSRGHETVRLPAVPATVVDVTGAGDAMLAAWVAAWLRGADPVAGAAGTPGRGRDHRESPHRPAGPGRPHCEENR